MSDKFEAFIKAKQERQRIRENRDPTAALQNYIEYRNQKKALLDKMRPQASKKPKSQPTKTEEWSFLDE
jgi:hypothetical protein